MMLGNVDYQLRATTCSKVEIHPKLIDSAALNVAFKKSNFDAFSQLLAHGADYTLTNKNGQTILHSIAISIVDRDSVFPISYINAILSAHITFQQTKNPHDPNGLSHFHAACLSNNVKAVEFFLNNGASVNEKVDINSPYFPGYTPLHFAVKYLNAQVIEVLLKHGANVSLKDTKGLTPISQFLKINYEMINRNYNTFQKNRDLTGKIGSLLLSHAANQDIMFIDDSGLSCLHVASAITDVVAVGVFLKKVANIDHCVNIKSALWPGYTALHFAAIFNIDIVKLLVRRGADLMIKNASGVTPWDLCLERYKVEDIHNIISLKSNWRNIVFSDGKTKLLDLINAMRSDDFFRRFLRRITNKAIITLPNDAPLWPGFTPMHLIILFSKSTGNLFDKYSKHVHNTYLDMASKLFDKNSKIIEIQDSQGCTPIHLCFRLGKMKNILNLLFEFYQKLDNPVDLVDKDNLSILHIACMKVNLVLIEKLLLNSENVNLAYKGKSIESMIVNGWTPLHIAAVQKHIWSTSFDETVYSNIIKALLDYRANINVKDANELTPIHLLIFTSYYKKNNNLSIGTHSLLSTPYLEDSVAGDLGLSHLHVACFHANLDAVRKLIDSGADINRKIKYLPKVYNGFCRSYGGLQLKQYVHKTPLDMALEYDEGSGVVDFLIQRGADVMTKDLKGTPLLYKALEKCNLTFASLVRTSPNLQIQIKNSIGSMAKLHFACISNDIKLIQDLLNNGADINATIRLDSVLWPGFTPLHLVVLYAYHYSEGMVNYLLKLLLDNGADVNAKTISSDPNFTPECTPLLVFMQSIEYRKEYMRIIQRVLKLLLDKGADVNVKIGSNSTTYPGWTPLHISTLFCSIITSKILLERKADVTLKNDKQETPIHMGFHNYISNLIHGFQSLSVLIKAHKDYSINPVDSKGISHFHIACNVADVDVVEKFLKYGNIDVNQPLKCSLNDDKRISVYSSQIAGGTPLHLTVTGFPNNDDKKRYVELVSQIETIDLLLKYGADVNAENACKETPFHIASHFELRERLVRAGANVNARDETLYSTLEHFVMDRRRLSDIKGLLRCGCLYNTYSCKGEAGCIGLTARTFPFIEMKQFLSIVIANFPNTIKADESGRTIIHNVVSTHQLINVSILEYTTLIEHMERAGCDLDDQDNLGRTALHLAVKFQNRNAISGLLLAGADINITDMNGDTAFTFVKQYQPCTRCDKPTTATDEQCQHYKVYQILAEQVEKLQLCRLDVCRQNLNMLTTAFPGFRNLLDLSDQFFDDLNGIENEKIESYSFTLYDFLSELGVVADYPTISQMKKNAINDYFHPSKFYKIRNKYREVAGSLKLQYRKALKRDDLFEKAMISLNVLAGTRLPDVCSHMILRFLKTSELEAMITASGYDSKMVID